MEFKDYTTMELPAFNQSPGENHLSVNSLEKFIIFAIAVLGVVGSSFIIASSTGSNNQPEFHNLSILAASAIQDIEEPAIKIDNNRFKDYVHISGKKSVGNTLTFIMQFPLEQGVRYWMDMGDGTRIMIRRSKFKYTYKEKGKYNITLNSTKNAIVTVLAKSQIKIK